MDGSQETRGLVKFSIGVRFPDLEISKALDSIDGLKELQDVLRVVITTTDEKAVLEAVSEQSEPKQSKPKKSQSNKSQAKKSKRAHH